MIFSDACLQENWRVWFTTLCIAIGIGIAISWIWYHRQEAEKKIILLLLSKEIINHINQRDVL